MRDINLTLPPMDVIYPLVDHYFTKMNTFHPILHRGLFMKSLQDQLDDNHFRAIVLLVCACGSRAADRTQPEPQSSDSHPGIQYFEQVEPFLRMPTPATPRLEDMQIFIVRQTDEICGSEPTFCCSFP